MAKRVESNTQTYTMPPPHPHPQAHSLSLSLYPTPCPGTHMKGALHQSEKWVVVTELEACL